MRDINLDNIIPHKYLKEIDEEAIEKDLRYEDNEYDTDVFTTVIRVKGSNEFNVVPVKSNKPVHKDLWIEFSKALSRLRVGPGLKIGDVICKNILNTGIDIVCTRNLKDSL